ncbi:hypothetical protein TREES_T100001649 [Tupaia chinensis]|uniref:Uncharacterized protein n=1 Tax=Tupaia chinensis TaxID=246437 RepID=L9KP23_TUPCH|nr:hypothetical protein TREES_T100001649 [Tupaia chinensis]
MHSSRAIALLVLSRVPHKGYCSPDLTALSQNLLVDVGSDQAVGTGHRAWGCSVPLSCLGLSCAFPGFCAPMWKTPPLHGQCCANDDEQKEEENATTSHHDHGETGWGGLGFGRPPPRSRPVLCALSAGTPGRGLGTAPPGGSVALSMAPKGQAHPLRADATSPHLAFLTWERSSWTLAAGCAGYLEQTGGWVPPTAAAHFGMKKAFQVCVLQRHMTRCGSADWREKRSRLLPPRQ